MQRPAEGWAPCNVLTCCSSLLGSGLTCAVAVHQLPEQLLCLRLFLVLLLQQLYWMQPGVHLP